MSDERAAQTILAEGRYLRLIAQGRWEFAERTSCQGAVVVVAVTPTGRLLLVEQFRIPIGRRTIELPAGLAGDTPDAHGEQLAAAAQRELLEETGYRAGAMTFLTEGPPSAGLSNEVVTFFLATQLESVHAGGGDTDEAISVHEVPVEAIEAWLDEKSQAGLVIDPKIYAGLYFLLRRR